MQNTAKNNFNHYSPTTVKTSVTVKKAPLLGAVTELILLLCAVALVLFIGVVALVHTLTLLTSTLGGYIFSLLLPGAALIFAAFVPVLSNPIHSLLCLLGLFASTALIYLSQGAEYLALVFLIVYVGALAILFLFVIMLLNVKDIMSAQKNTELLTDPRRMIPVAFGVLFAAHTTSGIREGFETLYLLSPELTTTTTNTLESVTMYVATDIINLRTLYSTHWPLFALITAILLEAMLGAIVLATTPNEFDSEEPTTPTETTTDVRTTATHKNNNLSVSEVKRLPSIAVPSSALQTPTAEAPAFSAAAALSRPAQTKERVMPTRSALTAVAYFTLLLLLTAFYTLFLSVRGFEFRFTEVFTPRTGAGSLFPPFNAAHPYPSVFVKRRFEITMSFLFVTAYYLLTKYSARILPVRGEEPIDLAWFNFLHDQGPLVSDAVLALRILVVHYLEYVPAALNIGLAVRELFTTYFPQYCPKTDTVLGREKCCQLLDGILNRFNSEIAQATAEPKLLEIQSRFNAEFFQAVASFGEVLYNPQVTTFLLRLNTLNGVIDRSINWAYAVHPLNGITSTLAEDLGYLYYELYTFRPETLGLYAAVSLIALALLQILFIAFHIARTQHPTSLYTRTPCIKKPNATTALRHSTVPRWEYSSQRTYATDNTYKKINIIPGMKVNKTQPYNLTTPTNIRKYISRTTDSTPLQRAKKFPSKFRAMVATEYRNMARFVKSAVPTTLAVPQSLEPPLVEAVTTVSGWGGVYSWGLAITLALGVTALVCIFPSGAAAVKATLVVKSTAVAALAKASAVTTTKVATTMASLYLAHHGLSVDPSVITGELGVAPAEGFGVDESQIEGHNGGLTDPALIGPEIAPPYSIAPTGFFVNDLDYVIQHAFQDRDSLLALLPNLNDDVPQLLLDTTARELGCRTAQDRELFTDLVTVWWYDHLPVQRSALLQLVSSFLSEEATNRSIAQLDTRRVEGLSDVEVRAASTAIAAQLTDAVNAAERTHSNVTSILLAACEEPDSDILKLLLKTFDTYTSKDRDVQKDLISNAIDF